MALEGMGGRKGAAKKTVSASAKYQDQSKANAVARANQIAAGVAPVTSNNYSDGSYGGGSYGGGRSSGGGGGGRGRW